VRKALTLIVLLSASSIFAAAPRFIAPLPGAQAIGTQTIEVETDAQRVDRVEFIVDGSLVGVARSRPYRIVHDFGTSAEARHVVAKVWSNGFTSVESAEIVTNAISAGESLTVDMVEVPMRIRSSRLVKATDLRVRENGRDQAIRELLPQRGAAHFVFVIDRSLSMGDGKLAAALRAIDDVRPMLRSGDRASILLFNHNVATLQSIAPGQSARQLYAGIVPSGGTSLRDALASLPSSDRTWAIVVSDGGDRTSLASEEDALRSISGTKTVVDALVLGTPSPFLRKAASNTGGTIRRVNRDDLGPSLRELIADINSRYIAVYQSTGGARGWRTLSVAARKSGVSIVTARKGYYAR
jgi:Mg-chelatase subunit ChlD